MQRGSLKTQLRYTIALLLALVAAYSLSPATAQADEHQFVSLQSLSHDNYATALSGGGDNVNTTSSTVTEFETLLMITKDDGTVRFKTFEGYYLCAWYGGGWGVGAYNLVCPEDYQTFIPVDYGDGVMAFMTTAGNVMHTTSDNRIEAWVGALHGWDNELWQVTSLETAGSQLRLDQSPRVQR